MKKYTDIVCFFEKIFFLKKKAVYFSIVFKTILFNQNKISRLMKKLINLLMVLLFVSAMVSCGAGAESEAPETAEPDTTAVQDVAPAADSTAADSTVVEEEAPAEH